MFLIWITQILTSLILTFGGSPNQNVPNQTPNFLFYINALQRHFINALRKTQKKISQWFSTSTLPFSIAILHSMHGNIYEKQTFRYFCEIFKIFGIFSRLLRVFVNLLMVFIYFFLFLFSLDFSLISKNFRIGVQFGLFQFGLFGGSPNQKSSKFKCFTVFSMAIISQFIKQNVWFICCSIFLFRNIILFEYDLFCISWLCEFFAKSMFQLYYLSLEIV
eukprot:TRINITY_DN1954_c1_g1_i4.p1 TRINITY_DN1954_c1_g1~~TRINITY_DN1954_c1_g1_i4.p1  ORF type:complete len:219 (+),score=-0.02 TRINITY_DN1954_c1_g1_i4:500-1156(+)